MYVWPVTPQRSFTVLCVFLSYISLPYMAACIIITYIISVVILFVLCLSDCSTRIFKTCNLLVNTCFCVIC
jgi:hypothetical protein